MINKIRQKVKNKIIIKMMMSDYKKRFIFSIILTIPVIILSPLIQQFLGININFFGSKYILFILSSLIFFYGGWPFLKGLYKELKDKKPGMMTITAVAISVVFL